MRPLKTSSSNHNFGPPLGHEGEIGDLPCLVDEHADGTTTIVTVWEPTPEERAALAAGGNIKLGVAWIGGFPPVSLSVTDEVAVDGD